MVKMGGPSLYGKTELRLMFVPRDFWVGLFWERVTLTAGIETIRLYICIVPMFPLRITYDRRWSFRRGKWTWWPW